MEPEVHNKDFPKLHLAYSNFEFFSTSSTKACTGNEFIEFRLHSSTFEINLDASSSVVKHRNIIEFVLM